MVKKLGLYMGYIFAGILISLLIWVVTRRINEHRLRDDPMLYTLKEVLKPLHPIIKNLKLYKGNKSYTINKDKIFLCLYDENGEYYPLNMLLHVCIHEIAHKLNTKDVGHTQEFYKVMEDLIKRATDLGIYNPNIPIIQNYCNHD